MSCFWVLNQKFRVFAAPSSETKEVLPNFSETPACSLFIFAFVFNHYLLIVCWLKVFGSTNCWRRCLWCTQKSFLHFFPNNMKSHSFVNCWAEKLHSFHRALLLRNYLLASEVCLRSAPCFEGINSVSKEQMHVLLDMKDVLRCRRTCHHSYQEVLLMIFSRRQLLYTQLCARRMQDCVCKISFLAQRFCWQTKLDLIPSQLRWRSSFPKLLCLLEVSRCLIRIKTALFSSHTPPWLKNPRVFFTQLSQCVESEAFKKRFPIPPLWKMVLPKGKRNAPFRTYFLNSFMPPRAVHHWHQK